MRIFHKKGFKYGMHHATQCKGGEKCGKKCNVIMNKQNDMTWYGGDLNQKQNVA
jgi:hypothetical protein